MKRTMKRTTYTLTADTYSENIGEYKTYEEAFDVLKSIGPDQLAEWKYPEYICAERVTVDDAPEVVGTEDEVEYATRETLRIYYGSIDNGNDEAGTIWVDAAEFSLCGKITLYARIDGCWREVDRAKSYFIDHRRISEE